MDPVTNPYAPGAGSPPPELAGRSAILSSASIHLQRLINGRSSKSVILVGLRGVGKTVLLDRIRKNAEHLGIRILRVEAPETSSLPALLAPGLRIALFSLSRKDAAKDLAIRAFQALAGFVTKLKVSFNDIDVALDYPPELLQIVVVDDRSEDGTGHVARS